MEQEQTPKDESHKAGGSMPDQPNTGEQTPTPADPVAETEPAEDTGDESSFNQDQLGDEDPGEDQEAAKAQEEEDKGRAEEEAAGRAQAEAESEGGERNE